MKKMLTAMGVLLLCLALPFGALAQKAAACGTEGHDAQDGLDHSRPQSCWVKGHFSCDGMNHERASCGIWKHYNCDGGTHEPAVCGAEGHYACDKHAHEAAACAIAGHCVSDGKKHEPVSCGIEGHYACDGNTHKAAACSTSGHYACDGLEHTRAACGLKSHYACDGAAHARPECGRSGHCVSDGMEHGAAPCGHEGHYLCDGREHELAACGVENHYACEKRAHLVKVISKYCDAIPQHRVCEGDPLHYCDPEQGGCGDTYRCSNSNAHTACRMCGLLWCDYTLGGHETPCGNANHRPCVYAMNGETYVKADHDWCGYCGRPRCENDGEHGNTKCVDACPNCGGPEKMDVAHIADCGEHYSCSGGSHAWCSECGAYACSGACTH